MKRKLTWEKPGQDEEKFRRYIIMALLRSGVCVALQDSHSDYLFIANLLDCWSVEAGVPPRDENLFGPELAAELGALKAKIRQTGGTGEIEVTVGDDRHFQFIVEAIPYRSDDVDLMTTIVDLSSERQREKVLRALLREVSHRSKNLLAIIQSVATQTAKHSDTLDGFLHKFRGRLFSLSHSQDLITDSSWQGVRFHELVNQQTSKYLPQDSHLIEISGENALLSPNASLHVGLALHELIANAVSYGSLISGGPPVEVACVPTQLEGKPAIQITWTETLAAAGTPDVRKGAEFAKHFGSVVLERVVPNSVDGVAHYTISKTGIFYELKFPIDDAA